MPSLDVMKETNTEIEQCGTAIYPNTCSWKRHCFRWHSLNLLMHSNPHSGSISSPGQRSSHSTPCSMQYWTQSTNPWQSDDSKMHNKSIVNIWNPVKTCRGKENLFVILWPKAKTSVYKTRYVSPKSSKISYCYLQVSKWCDNQDINNKRWHTESLNSDTWEHRLKSRAVFLFFICTHTHTAIKDSSWKSTQTRADREKSIKNQIYELQTMRSNRPNENLYWGKSAELTKTVSPLPIITITLFSLFQNHQSTNDISYQSLLV